MSLPPSYSGLPDKEQHNYLRDVCIEFKKMINTSKNVDDLEYQMQRFLDVSKQVSWPHTETGVYRKDEAEKAVQKVWTEFKRYVNNIETESPQDLLDAISNIETFLPRLKVR